MLVRHLQRIYTEPVYGLGVLPASDEGGLYSLNAARSVQTYVRETDNLLLVDNDAWRKTGESVSGGYGAINREVAQRFGVLFSAGEYDAGANVGQSVVDSSEIINTLAGGGVSTVGYASETIDLDSGGGGLLSRFTGDRSDGIDDSANTMIRCSSSGRGSAGNSAMAVGAVDWHRSGSSISPERGAVPSMFAATAG